MSFGKVVRTSHRVAKIALRPTNRSLPRTVQRGTVKYLPFVYHTVQTGNLDLKSIENASLEIFLYDVSLVSLNVALVLLRSEFKKRV
jgi:hypothetical protein